MLDPKDCGVTMPHKISFSIIDILDPKKFNSRRVNELSVAKETFPAQRADGADLLDCDRTAGGDVESAEAGRKIKQPILGDCWSVIQLVLQLKLCCFFADFSAEFDNIS